MFLSAIHETLLSLDRKRLTYCSTACSRQTSKTFGPFLSLVLRISMFAAYDTKLHYRTSLPQDSNITQNFVLMRG